MFDPETFLSTTASGPMAVEYEALPAGDNYIGIIEKVAARSPKDGMFLIDITWLIDDPVLADKLNLKTLTARQSIFLDIDANGSLSNGRNKNVRLGLLRATLGQNSAKKWQISSLIGAGPARLKIEHNVNKETGKTYVNVTNVTKL